jgi:hydroxyacylglutathione hydrolase
MKLLPLTAFSDNYIWMIHNGREALVVDPGDASPVLHALQLEGLQLKGILVTHHHLDHTGGVAALRESTGANVYGPARENIPLPYQKVQESDTLELLGLRFTVLDVPGHTAGHVAFFCPDMDGTPLVFCGDTLFSAGCGRLFEGTAAQMQQSLEHLAHLPGETLVCCTHEYTMGNLKFALAVEPYNQDLQAHFVRCKELRAQSRPTLPSTISLELRINPFLRSQTPAVIASAQCHAADEVTHHGVFATLRNWKNNFQ